MKRREFITLLGGAAAAWPVVAHAQQPEPGDQRIESAGPRLMIVGIPVEQLKDYPSGRNPDTTKPYVMWAGTEYAHLMVPVR